MSYIEHFKAQVVTELKHCIDNAQSSAILIQTASQNSIPIMTAITEFVALIGNWGPTDCSSYSNFSIARERLYFKYNIYLDVVLKPMTHPDSSFEKVNVGNYNTLFMDNELNHNDPYFDTIKRDYYNEVSS